MFKIHGGILSIATSLLYFPLSLSAQSTNTSTVYWSDTHQRIDGFGACSAWMSDITDAQADQLFTTKPGGIGLSLLRAQIRPGGSSWDYPIMKKAQARGVKCWSAPWSPAANFKTNGSEQYGGFVIRSKYAEYAAQMANYVLAMKRDHGINLYAVSINNEPLARPPFESCQWTAQQLHDFVPYLHDELVKRGVGSTKIMLPESQTWDTTLANRTMEDPKTAAMVGIIAAHDYAGAGPGPLNSYGKPLWQTEKANPDLIDTTAIAIQLHQHMAVAESSAWHAWWLNQTNEDGGLLRNGNLTKQMAAMGNFSRFIRPGYYRMGASMEGEILTSAYRDWRSTNFVIVAVNPTATAITQTFTLSGSGPVSSVAPWVTSPVLNLAAQGAVPVTNQTFTYQIPGNGVVTFTGKTPPNPGPQVTPISRQFLYQNEASEPLTFTVGDAAVAPSSLSVEAICTTNTALFPAASFAFRGTGAERSLQITPAANLTGNGRIQLTVRNGTDETTVSFLATVLPLPVSGPAAVCTADGPINQPGTWGGTLPVARDIRLWKSGANTIALDASPYVFHGGTLAVETGGALTADLPRAGLTLNNLNLNGGTIFVNRNLGFILNFNSRKFTLNGGTLRSGGAANQFLVITNSDLAGSGTIAIIGAGTNGSQVQFQSSNLMSGFTGTFDVRNNGVLDLPPISAAEASFDLSVSGTGKYNNEFNVAVKSLTLNGVAIPKGVYPKASFTVAQQVLFKSDKGVITVVGP